MTMILAIESSCDETACAVVRDGNQILSNIVSSQINVHTLYGGVVPEVASRIHVENISAVVAEALQKADVILAKGQGNFETLRGCGYNVFYLFLCKCELFRNRFRVPAYTGMIIRESEAVSIL